MTEPLLPFLLIMSHFTEREREREKKVDLFVTADEEGLLWKLKRVLRQQQQRSCMCS